MQQTDFTGSNPIFEYDLRKFGLNDSNYDRRDRGLIITVAVISTIIAIVSYIANQQRSSFFVVGPLFLSIVLSLLYVVLPFVASMYYMFLTVSSVNSELIRGAWEDVRLTNVPEDEIFAAKYAIAQLRVHRMLAIVRATQIVGVIFSMVLPWYMPTMVRLITGSDFVIFSPFIAWLLKLGFGVVFAYYVPLWAMKAIIAAGMYCAIRFRHSTSAMLGGLFMIFVVYLALRIVQLMVEHIAAVVFVTSSGGNFDIDLMIKSTVYSLISGVLLYGYFSIVKVTALRLASDLAWRVE